MKHRLGLRETGVYLPDFLAIVNTKNAGGCQKMWLSAFALSISLMVSHGIVHATVRWPVPMFPKSEVPVLPSEQTAPVPPNQPEPVPLTVYGELKVAPDS